MEPGTTQTGTTQTGTTQTGTTQTGSTRSGRTRVSPRCADLAHLDHAFVVLVLCDSASAGQCPARNRLMAADSATAISRSVLSAVSNFASALFLILPHSIRTFGIVVRFSPAKSFLKI